jgi:tetratricopeptide (TPR) repeat protein
MKRNLVRTVVSFLFVALCLSVCAQAQSPTPQQTLQQYVADLQKDPNDSALREKIIKLAQEMKLAPAAPAEVHELAGRAGYAIKNATSEADFVAAAEAYGKASLLAPWVADYYFNGGVAYEKANRFDDAIAAFNWYLLAAPNAKDANEVRERIGGLKYAREKAVRDRQEAERATAARMTAERELERKRTDFSGDWKTSDGHMSYFISKDSSGRYNVYPYLYHRDDDSRPLNNIRVDGNVMFADFVTYSPRVITWNYQFTLAADGNSLQVVSTTSNGGRGEYTIARHQ